jgi:hypothetical protein
MINWDTGDGSSGEVYLFVEGHGEQLFSSGSKGSNEAPWISTGGIYEFRLYQATNRAKLLASVKVTRNPN